MNNRTPQVGDIVEFIDDFAMGCNFKAGSRGVITAIRSPTSYLFTMGDIHSFMGWPCNEVRVLPNNRLFPKKVEATPL